MRRARAPASSIVGNKGEPGARAAPGARVSTPAASQSVPSAGATGSSPSCRLISSLLAGSTGQIATRERPEDRQERAEDRLDARVVPLLLLGPRRRAVDILVRGRSDGPRPLERAMRLDAVPRLQRVVPVALERRVKLLLQRRPLPLRGHLSGRHLRAETERARQQVAEVLAEVRVVPLDHRGQIEVPVLPERDRAQKLVAEHVGPARLAADDATERAGDPQRLDRVAERLAHLLPAEGQKPVREDGRRQREPGAHEKRRPVSPREIAGCPCRRGARSGCRHARRPWRRPSPEARSSSSRARRTRRT